MMNGMLLFLGFRPLAELRTGILLVKTLLKGSLLVRAKSGGAGREGDDCFQTCLSNMSEPKSASSSRHRGTGDSLYRLPSSELVSSASMGEVKAVMLSFFEKLFFLLGINPISILLIGSECRYSRAPKQSPRRSLELSAKPHFASLAGILLFAVCRLRNLYQR